MNIRLLGLGLFFVISFFITAAGAAAENGAVALWTAPAAQKVFRTDGPPGAGGKAALDLAAARGEVESTQLVLRPEHEVELTSAKIGNLTAANQRSVITNQVSLFRVGYVRIEREKKDYPDPLPPLRLPLRLAAGTAQPLWVNVKVPWAAAAGIYSGELALGFSDGTRAAVPLRLRVFDFALPKTPSARTAFGLSYPLMLRQEGAPAKGGRADTLRRQYYEMLLEHRVSAYELPCDLKSPEAARLLEKDPRLTSFRIPYSDNESSLTATITMLRDRECFGKGYFYQVDEPKTAAEYAHLRQVCEKIHKLAPEAKIVAPYYCAPAFDKTKTPYDMMDGLVNIWCPVSNVAERDVAPLRERQAKGGELWWYVCCGPGKPYPNLMVDWPGIDHRILFWQQKWLGVQGLLYWSTTHWDPKTTPDPWRNIGTYVTKDKHVSYGDGSLFYPGRTVGESGPVSSIRLELVREGLDDFDYLTLHEKKMGAAATRALLGQAVGDKLKTHETNPAKLEALRRKLAGEIENGKQ